MALKQNAISAKSLSSTRKDKQQYLNAPYKILVEQCKKEELGEVREQMRNLNEQTEE